MVRLKRAGGVVPDPVPGFQFLMVRLKQNWRKKGLIKFKFQFLMVRLKPGNQINVALGEDYFNSLWFD